MNTIMKWTAGMHTRHRELGLTLLEVLAAAMIFAMVMTVLIGTSSTAVHNIGVSARRLEANLVADAILADLEIQMKQGTAPEVAQDESVRDQYSIRVLRTDILPNPGSGDPNGLDIGIASMLGAELPEVAKYLKQYDIEVSWFEQNGPQSVTRTTFAYDWQNAAIEFSDLFQQSRGNGGGGGQFGGGGGTSGGGSGDGSLQGGNQSNAGTGAGATNARGGPRRRNGHNARLDAEARARGEL